MPSTTDVLFECAKCGHRAALRFQRCQLGMAHYVKCECGAEFYLHWDSRGRPFFEAYVKRDVGEEAKA